MGRLLEQGRLSTKTHSKAGVLIRKRALSIGKEGAKSDHYTVAEKRGSIRKIPVGFLKPRLRYRKNRRLGKDEYW